MVAWLAPALPSDVPTAPPVNDPKRFVNVKVLLYVVPTVAGSIVQGDGVMSTPSTVPVMSKVAGPAVMLTGRLTGVPRGSVIELALENVPSFPTQVALYVIEPPIPDVRVNVIVRVPVWPGAHPSRS